MKVEWIATFLIALIGTFLMGLSVQTTRDLSITVETIKNRMHSQEDQLAATKSQMSSVAGELTRIKETQAVMTQHMDDLLREDVIELGDCLPCIVKDVGGIHFFLGKIAREKDFPEFVNHFLDRGGKMDGLIPNVGKTGVVGHGCHDSVNHPGQFPAVF